MKYYRILQGKFVDDKYVQPEFPVTDESMERMIKSGIAEEILQSQSKFAKWGSGNYVKVNEEWTCLSSKWDTSG